MIIIKEADPTIGKFWGKQSVRSERYRKFRYLVETPCDKGLLVHNTVSGELIFLNEEESLVWEALPDRLPSSFDELIQRRYLVPKGFDDKKSVDSLRILMKKIRRSRDITMYLILPTTGCNARCFYCYESNYPHHAMTPAVTKNLVNYILAHDRKHSPVKLIWFGGEPMLGKNVISDICSGLQNENIPFTSTMVSNGYLFTPELVREARRSWRLEKIQITLDGTEEIYNRTKAYVNAAGSPYRRVLDNILLLLQEGIRVTVRMNLDEHNAGDLHLLIDELSERFAGMPNFFCYVHELFDKEGFTPIAHTGEALELLKEKRDSFSELIREKHLRLPASKTEFARLGVNFCMADDSSAVTVNPLGQLGKCEHFAYEHLIGDLESDITDRDETNAWLQPSYLPSCEGCPLYPSCARITGCPSARACAGPEIEYRISQNRSLARQYYNDYIREK